MNAKEIEAGKNYILKIACNEVKVKVINYTGRSWIVRTAGGKVMPVNNAQRFVSLVESAAKEVKTNYESHGTKSNRKLSMLDATVEILKDASNPMSAKELIATMEETGLWKTGKGLTPANTLSAALNREIAGKEKPRFQKAGKGLFILVEKLISGDKQ